MNVLAIGVVVVVALICVVRQLIPKKPRAGARVARVLVAPPRVSLAQLAKGYLVNCLATAVLYVIAALVTHLYVIGRIQIEDPIGRLGFAFGVLCGPMLVLGMVLSLNPYFPKGYLKDPARQSPTFGDLSFGLVFLAGLVAVCAASWPMVVAAFKQDFSV